MVTATSQFVGGNMRLGELFKQDLFQSYSLWSNKLCIFMDHEFQSITIQRDVYSGERIVCGVILHTSYST